MSNNPTMKSILITLLIFSAFVAQGQTKEKVVVPDSSKIMGSTPSSPIMKAKSIGTINPKSIDLKWKPMLSKKYKRSDMEEPNQKIIDSLNDVHYKIKNNYYHSNIGNSHYRK